MTEQLQKWGTAWAEGRDPEEYGWRFTETGQEITGYDCYDIIDRASAAALGVPGGLLDLFEEQRATGYDWEDFDSWLQEHVDLFTPVDGPGD